MTCYADLECKKIIPLNDDTPQDIVSFLFFDSLDDTSEFVLINTPNGGFMVSKYELFDMFKALENQNPSFLLPNQPE